MEDNTNWGLLLALGLVALALLIIAIAGMWLTYKKARRPGWAVLIPIYSTLVLIWIVKKPWWWILLLVVPGVNIVISIIIMYRLSLAFGKGVGMTIVLYLFSIIGFLVLGFGESTYKASRLK